MTVLVATTGGRFLDIDDRPVRRVDTLAAVRAGSEAAAVVVVDGVVDGTPTEVASAVREAAPETPVVRYGASDDPDAFDRVVESTDSAALRTAVDVAIRVVDYRRAVDDLYEQCLARASGEGTSREFYDALERARRGFDEIHQAAGATPYPALLGRRSSEPEDVVEFREALDGPEGGREE